jgi:hypothetical protein
LSGTAHRNRSRGIQSAGAGNKTYFELDVFVVEFFPRLRFPAAKQTAVPSSLEKVTCLLWSAFVAVGADKYAILAMVTCERFEFEFVLRGTERTGSAACFAEL